MPSEPAPDPREDERTRARTGEMARRIAELDWARTPLGPRESWPQSLHTAVDICLASRFPIVMFWGPELRLIYNDGYRPMLGSQKHPHALGQPAAEVWAEIWDVIEPMFDSVLERREATWSDDQLLLIDRDGVEESYFTFSYSPVAGEAGEVAGVFCAVTETTARVLGERRLAALRDLASSTADARTVEDACLRAVASLSGNRLDMPLATLHLIGGNGATATFGDTPLLTEPQVASVAADGDRRRFDGLSVDVDLPLLGAQTVTSALALPIQQAGQDTAQAVLVVGISPVRKLDPDYLSFFELTAGQVATALADAGAYTAERARAERLAELDRAKTEFFSNVSHEFRTPLTLMLGPLEEALGGPDGSLGREAREAVAVAHRNALRLLKLVNTLLDFSRVEAGRMQASFEPVDLAGLTVDLASVFRSAVERAGMRLEIDCAQTTDTVWVDRALWEKIVLNLLSNAFKFTFEGSITVRLRARSGRVELLVEDTGIGIPETELPYLFERFHRVQGVRSRSHEGSGIGLALVRELVRLHGGTIEVASAVDRGTVFTVSVPTGSSHLPADRIAAPRELASTSTAGDLYVEEALRWLPEDLLDGSAATPAEEATAPEARILLVDDNADMRAYVRRLLGARYQVETAPDGMEALEAARRVHPDLVISDVMMPRLDGMQLLAELRADPLTRDVPVILLSARAGEESRIEGLDAGADDYLAKPFAANELRARVRAQIELARVRREALETIQEDEERQAFFLTLSDALRPILDPVEVQTTAARLVGRHLGVARAMYAEVEEDGVHFVVHRDYCDDGVPSARGRYRVEDFGSTLSAAAYAGTALAVDDVAADRQLTESELARFTAIGIDAFAFVPLVKGNGLAGLLVVHHTTPRRWKPDELALLEETAERTWAAIQRARAEAALEQDLRDMDLLRSLAGRLASDADEETLYQDVLEVAIAIAHADGGELVVLEEGGDLLRTVARAGIAGGGAPAYTTLLTSRSGAPLGSLSTWRERRRPSATETRFLDLLARQAADIIEHRRAQQALRERERERQERLAERARRQHWLAGEQAERARWARELHDETLQGLAAIQVQLVAALQAPTPSADRLEAVVSLVHGEIGKLRSLIAELRPPALAEYGLAPALAALADETKQRGGPDVVLAVDLGDGDGGGRLSEDLELSIYRVVQEALTNASRHAGATRVEVEVRRRAAVVEAIVRDDGSGFAPGTPTTGFGLVGMAERAAIVGGTLDITSGEGRGTSVRLETPVS